MTPLSFHRAPLFKLFFVLTVGTLINLPATISFAETSEDKGKRIAYEADEYDKGFINYRASQKMVLRNRKGQESIRVLKISVLENEESGDKSLIVFNRPRDVRGTAMLTHSHKIKDDDQWLYLPALKRVKRISSSNKSGSFMGSEFSYEDMTSQEIEKYSYLWLRDEPCGNLLCWVTERRPKSKNSGYSRQISWIGQKEYRVWKTEYYDRKNTLLKTLIVDDYNQYQNKHWRATNMFMTNHLTGKSTELIWEDYEFNIELDNASFTKVSLKRAR